VRLDLRFGDHGSFLVMVTDVKRNGSAARVRWNADEESPAPLVPRRVAELEEAARGADSADQFVDMFLRDVVDGRAVAVFLCHSSPFPLRKVIDVMVMVANRFTYIILGAIQPPEMR